MNGPAFGDLSVNERMKALNSENLIETEDALLNALLKWVQLNPLAPKEEVEELYDCMRLERLYDITRLQELCASYVYPSGFVALSSRLGLQCIEADFAMRCLASSICVDPESVKVFIRGQDSAAGASTHFWFGNFAMSANLFEIDNLFLCLKPDRRLALGSDSFRKQAVETKFNVFVVETSTLRDGNRRI